VTGDREKVANIKISVAGQNRNRAFPEKAQGGGFIGNLWVRQKGYSRRIDAKVGEKEKKEQVLDMGKTKQAVHAAEIEAVKAPRGFGPE